MFKDRNIIKSVLGVFAMLLCVTVSAQQDPSYSHFSFFKQGYNPAAAGEVEKRMCFSLINHTQWRGYDDQTYISGTEGERGGGKVVENVAPATTAFAFGGQSPLDKREKHNVGLGVTFNNDKLGFIKTTSFRIQANYQINLMGGFAKLAIGPEMGMTQVGIDNPNYIAFDDFDPRIPAKGGSQSQFDLGFGVFYTQKQMGPLDNFSAGASISHIPQPIFDVNIQMQSGSSENLNFEVVRHLYFHSGFEYDLGSITLEPAFLIKYNTRPQFDMSVTALFMESFRAGIGYRQWGNADGIPILLGYQTALDKKGEKTLRVGYSYDLSISRVRQVSNGTHEIFARFCMPLEILTPPDPSERRKSVRWL